MAIDYTTLVGDKDQQGSIKNWLNNSTIPSTTILVEAEQWIYQRLRIRQMVQSGTGTFSNSDNGVLTLSSVASTYRAPIYFELKDQSDDARVFPTFTPDIAEVYRAFSYDGSGNRQTGAPSLWGTNATQIVFDTYAASGTTYDYTLLYYGSLTPLGPSNTTNILTTRYPKLLRMVYMYLGYEFQEDDARANMYLQKAMSEIMEAEKEKDLEYMGADLRMGVPGMEGQVMDF